MIALKPVQSSLLKAVGYDPTSQTLAVQFTSGAVYHYPGVTQADYSAMMSAPSIGGHFGKHIRGEYQGVLAASAERSEGT